MKIFLALVIGSVSFLSYAQENTIESISIEWEQLVAPLSLHTKSVPNKYQLLEVDLSVNLREQYLNKDASSLMILPENKFIQPNYNVAIPQPKTKNTGFSISGNGYNSNLNTSGRIKNTAYKDAGLYSGAFCPITGLAY